MAVLDYSKFGGIEGDYHRVALPEPGRYRVEYAYYMYDIPDELEIRFGNRKLLDTGMVSGGQNGEFEIDYAEDGPSELTYVLGAVHPGTGWDYSVRIVPLESAGSPSANDDSATLDGDDPKTFSLIGNDTAADAAIDPASIEIVDGPKHGTVTVNADGTVTYGPTGQGFDDSFTYTIADEDGDRSNAATVTIDGDCASPDPLTVTATPLEHNDATGKCEGGAPFFLGRTDGKEQFLWHVNGTVAVDQSAVAVRDAKVESVVGTLDGALFYGGYTMGRDGKTTSLSDVGGSGELTIAGLEFFAQSMSLEPQRLLVNGRFELPARLGNQPIDLQGINNLLIDDAGARFGNGKIALPSYSLDLWDVLEVEQTGTTLDFDYVQNLLKLQGKLKITDNELFKNEQLSGGSSAVIDLSGPNYIQVKDGIVDMKGAFSMENVAITSNWGFKELKLELRTDKGVLSEVTGTAAVSFPWHGRAATEGGTLGFITNPTIALNTVGIASDGLALPVGTTGVVWQKASGQVTGLAPNDPEGVEFKGGLGFTYGPERVFLLPAWLKEDPVTAAVASLDLSGTAAVSSQTGAFTLAGEALLKFITDGVADIKIGGSFDIDRFKFDGTAELKALGGAILGNGKLAADFTAGKVTLQAVGSGGVPDVKGFGLLRGKQFGALNAQMVFDYANGVDKGDYVAAWGAVELGSGGPAINAGMKLAFDGSFQPILGAKAVPLIGSWATSGVEPFLLMTAEWENAQAGAVAVQVTWDDGSGTLVTYDEADFAAHGIAVVGDLTNPYAKSVVVNEPAAGIWDVVIVDPAPLGAVTYAGYGAAAAPAVTILGATPKTVPDYRIDIRYQASDPDSDATVQLYWDADASGHDGTLIAAGLPEQDGISTYEWQPLGAPSGPLYLYAAVVDETGVPVFGDYLAAEVDGPPAADLSVEILGPETAKPGAVAEYQVRVTNNGTVAAAEVGIVVTWSGGDLRSWTGRRSGDQVSFDRDLLLAGETHVGRLWIEAPADGVAVQIEAEAVANNEDPDPSNNFAVLATPVEAAAATADLALSYVLHRDGGDDDQGYVEYDLVVENRGAARADGIVVTELVDGPRTIAPRTVHGWGEGYSRITYSDGKVVWDVLPIDPGERVALPVLFQPDGIGTLALDASVTHRGDDPFHANDTASLDVPIETFGFPSPPVDLQVQAATSNSTPAVGDLVTLSAYVGRLNSFSLVGNVKLQLDLSDGLEFTRVVPVPSYETTQGTYDSATGVWDVGTMVLPRYGFRIEARVTTADPVSFRAELISTSDPDPDSTPANGAPGEDDLVIVAMNSDNAAPEIANPIARPTVTEGEAFSLVVPEDLFSDPDGDPVHWRLSGKPDWLDWDPATRTLSGTIEDEDMPGHLPGLYLVDGPSFVATDGRGGYTTYDTEMYLRPVNDPPVPEEPLPDRLVTAGTPVSFSIFATEFVDPDFDPNIGYVNEGVADDGGPVEAFELDIVDSAWLSWRVEEQWEPKLDEDGNEIPGEFVVVEREYIFYGTPGADDVGAAEVTVAVSDWQGARHVETFTVTVNAPPVAETVPAGATLSGAGILSYQLPDGLFSDPDGDPIELSARCADGRLLPLWLAFDPETRTLFGNPPPADEGALDLVLRAADGRGGLTAAPFTLTVADANDAPGGAVLIGAIAEHSPAGTVAGQVGAQDADLGDDHVFELLDDAGGRFTLDAATGVLRTTAALDFEAAPAHEIRVRATDAAGTSAETVLSVPVRDRTGDLFTDRADAVDFNGLDPDYTAGSQYDARAGDDVVILPADAAAAAAAGYDPAATFRAGAGDDRVTGGALDDHIDGGIGRDTLDGGAGFDTVDYAFAGAAANLDVDLLRGDMRLNGAVYETVANFEAVIAGAGADILAGTDGPNRLEGGAGRDLLLGRGGDDVLVGGPHVDWLDGGDGSDTVDYAYAPASAPLDIDLARGDMRFVGMGAPLETLVSIENVVGGAGTDRLYGDAGPNRLEGGSGADRLEGRGGDDWLVGGIGPDSFDGGAGNDTVDWSFAGPTAAIDVDLVRGDMRFPGGAAPVEPLTGIENLVGGAGSDRLAGDGADNRLEGGAGNDRLEGRGGADVLLGGAGQDVLLGGDGDDWLVGGIGADSFDGGAGTDTADWSHATAETRLDLDLARGDMRFVGSAAAVETLISIENIVAGAGADILAGDAGDNLFRGGGGSDRFILADDLGRDTIEDFAAGAGSPDVVDLAASVSLRSFADVLASASDGAFGVEIALGAGVLVLAGVQTAQLHAGDFAF